MRRCPGKRSRKRPSTGASSGRTRSAAALAPASDAAATTKPRGKAPSGRPSRANQENPGQDGHVQDPLDDEGSRHGHGRRPKLAAKAQDPQRVAGPQRRHVVDRHAGEEGPGAGAERQGGLKGAQHPPPAHDAHRPAGGQEGQGEQDRGDRQTSERPAQRVKVHLAREQPHEPRRRGETDRQLQPSHRPATPPQARPASPPACGRGTPAVPSPDRAAGASPRRRCAPDTHPGCRGI